MESIQPTECGYDVALEQKRLLQEEQRDKEEWVELNYDRLVEEYVVFMVKSRHWPREIRENDLDWQDAYIGEEREQYKERRWF